MTNGNTDGERLLGKFVIISKKMLFLEFGTVIWAHHGRMTMMTTLTV